MRSFQYLAPIGRFDYVAPDSLEGLFQALEGHGKKAVIIAGGTDLMVALKERTVAPDLVVDLGHLREELGGIAIEGGVLRIGALATFFQIEADPLVRRYANALRQAAANVGTLQIRALATLGGNLATASPAADSAPPLIALKASANLMSRRGPRTVPVQSFFTGVKKSSLAPGEIVSSVDIPADERAVSLWARAAARKENVLSTVSVAVASTIRDGAFVTGRVALGAVAPTPILAEKASGAMAGSRATAQQAEKIAALAVEDSRPISDIRASAEYRKHLVLVLTRRLLLRMISEGT